MTKERKILCLGGPLDGGWYEPHKVSAEYRVEVFVITNAEKYDRLRVFVHKSLSVKTAAEMLTLARSEAKE